MLDGVLDNLPLGNCRVSAASEEKIILSSPKLEEFLGYNPQGMKIADLFSHPLEWDGISRELREKESTQNKKAELKKKTGEKITCWITASLVSREKETYFDCAFFFTPQEKGQLSQEKMWLEALFTNATEAIVLFDNNHRVVDINPRFRELFHYNLEEIKGLDIDEVLERNKKGGTNRNLTQKLLRGETVETEGIRYNRFGKGIHFLIKGIPVIIDGNMVGGYAVYADITERKKAEERIRHLSLHDGLTGLYNRAYLEEQIARLNRQNNLPIGVIFMDVNGLKLINDAYGYETGDMLIKTVADNLSKICRGDDIIARWGGDEFALLLPSTGRAEIMAITRRIRDAFREITVEGVPVLFSLGWACKNSTHENLSRILQNAEDRMFREKIESNRTARNTIIKAFMDTLSETTFENADHIRRLTKMGREIAAKLNLSSQEEHRLFLLLNLHDVGMIGIGREIIQKPGTLSSQEWEIVKTHPEIGSRIALAAEDYAPIAAEIKAHHENWDGTGYPEGLKGEEIPYLARIASILDTFDAITHNRPYRKALPRKEALREIKGGSGTQFDPSLVETFLDLYAAD